MILIFFIYNYMAESLVVKVEKILKNDNIKF